MKLATKTRILAAVFAASAKQAVGQDKDLGDLIRLYRDNYGRPILAHNQNPCDLASKAGCCLWPLASTSASTACPSNCMENKLESDQYETNMTVIPEDMIDSDTCAVNSTCTSCLMETDFGRTNVFRSPPHVLDAQYDEAIKSLELSLCPVDIDPAGRLVYYVPGEVEPEAKTIDSPLQNLAIYRQLIGEDKLFINDIGNYFNIPHSAGRLMVAARGLGAAFDKGGEVTVDVVAYMNRIINLTETSTLDKKCVFARKEVMGDPIPVEECVVDFSSFDYDRDVNFDALPQPPYFPSGGPNNGWFEHLWVDNTTATACGIGNIDDCRFKITQQHIMAAEDVFEVAGGSEASNIAGFVKAADDARAVINFMHNWPVPSVYATNPTCVTSQPDPVYNVYIKALQVPIYIQKGAEEREFTVTVELTTVTWDAEDLEMHINAVHSEDDTLSEDYTWPAFSLGPSTATYTWSGTGSVNVTLTERNGDITWTANIKNAPDDYNPADNTMTAMTTVHNPSGGGQPGGGRGGWLRGL